MDIKQLKFLIALDETRHFGQAAARCHVTQPTLSMRLRQLEDELGLELVHRGQRFEGFSAEGERILAWARSLLAAQEGLLAEAAACRGQLIGTLRVGVVPLAGFDPMPLVSLFAERHPGLRFELHALSSEQILERLTRNQLDLGLSYLERLDREHFAWLQLAQPRMGLLYSSQHFSFSGQALRWEELAALPLGLLSSAMHFRQSIDHSFRARNLSAHVRLQTDSVHQLMQAVSAGLCCSIMPLDSSTRGADQHLQLMPIEQAQTLSPLGLIMRRSAPISPLAQASFKEAQEWLAAQAIDAIDQNINSSN